VLQLRGEFNSRNYSLNLNKFSPLSVNKVKISPMDDREAVSRCLAGDHKAFEALVNKYQANVLTFNGIILGDREEAKDVSQEAFIHAFLNLKLFDTNKSFKNWLYAIAYRKCIDIKRREKLFSKYLQRSAKENYHYNMGKVERKRSLEESDLLGPVLQKLSQRERIAVLLQMNEGYSTQEIAEILQCSESTARVTLHNAKRKIKSHIGENENV